MRAKAEAEEGQLCQPCHCTVTWLERQRQWSNFCCSTFDTMSYFLHRNRRTEKKTSSIIALSALNDATHLSRTSHISEGQQRTLCFRKNARSSTFLARRGIWPWRAHNTDISRISSSHEQQWRKNAVWTRISRGFHARLCRPIKL